MKSVYIRGNASLYGEVTIQGSKNAALPIMAAPSGTGSVCTQNCPRKRMWNTCAGSLHASDAGWTGKEGKSGSMRRRLADSRLPKEYVTRMRSSVMLMGPLLGRLGEVSLSHPGGCVIGDRRSTCM